MPFTRLSTALVACLGFALFTEATCAQTSQTEQVYLEEPAAEPPAKVARRRKVEEKFKDDSVHVEREVAQLSDDTVVNDGTYIEYYRDGQKHSEGRYELGVLVGEWKYWHPNGELRKTVTFQEGKPHGKIEVFRADGTLEATQNYRAGVRHGEWVSYYDDGETPKIRVPFQDGRIHGDRYTYHENGQERQKVPFENGQINGTMTEWDTSGNKVAEATFKNGQTEGPIERF